MKLTHNMVQRSIQTIFTEINTNTFALMRNGMWIQ